MGNEERDMHINQSLANVDVGLFSRPRQAQEPAETIPGVVSARRGADRASFFEKGASKELEGHYTDPRLRAVDSTTRSEATNRTLDVMKALRDGALQQIEASWRGAVERETGTSPTAGEHLSVDDWETLSGDLRRSRSEVSLLGVRLAVANGDFTHAGSIGFPGKEEFTDMQVRAENVIESMATFRMLQIETVVSQVRDGSVAALAERAGATENLALPDITALSDVDLDAMRAHFVTEGMAQYERGALAIEM
jgi:hypothetical protein